MSVLRTHWRVGIVALLLLRFGVYHYLSGHSRSPQVASPSGTGQAVVGGASAIGVAPQPREIWQRQDPTVGPPQPEGCQSVWEAVAPVARDPNRKLLESASHGQVDLMKDALEHGADPNVARGTRWETPLMLAARSGNIEAVRLILAQPGINPYAENRDYETALTYARDRRIRVLLEQKGLHK